MTQVHNKGMLNVLAGKKVCIKILSLKVGINMVNLCTKPYHL